MPHATTGRSGHNRRAMREWLGHRNIKNTAVYAQLVTRDSAETSEPEG